MARQVRSPVAGSGAGPRPGLTIRSARLSLALLLTGLVLAGCSTEGDLPTPAARAPAAPPNSIFVSRGDNLYKLAQQYSVPVRDLIEANGLTAPFILQPGQRLTLPVPKLYVVKSGDTLYGLSRQYQVDMAEMVRLNGLQQPYSLKTGQTLRLPGQSPAMAVAAAVPPSPAAAPVPAAKPPTPAPGRKPELPPAASSSPTERSQRPAIEVATLPPPAPAATVPPASRPVAGGTGAAGSAAGRKGVEPESLAPPSASPSAPATVTPERRPMPATATPQGAPQTPVPVAPSSPAEPTEVPPAQLAAAPPPAPPKEDVPPARAGNRFLWPIRGPILSGFGDKPGGLRNDGINIGAPKGTAVMSADNGIVAYAGNQLKSFGNLVLIRHDGGWVTVYAHLDAIAVEQGQRVTRGQGIGTVGQTGNVRSSQLHFAVRRGEQVLNPLDQLEK